MNINFEGKTVVVTGAAGGLGKDMVNAFSNNGANVVICDIKNTAAIAEEINKNGGNAIGLDFDLTDREAVGKAVEEIKAKFGKVDVLVNNAGVNVGPEERKTVEEFSDKWWDFIQNVDLTGVFNCSKAIIPIMNKDSASIINISSVVGIAPLRKQCSFAAAKAGVINLSKAMAMELADKNIRVNVVAPGSVAIDITNKLWQNDSAMKGLLAHIPMNRQAKPSEISSAVMFLASEYSQYITGVVLPVDGGWTAGGYMRDF